MASLASATTARDARAQTDTTTRRTCWRGNRFPACDRFVVTELSAYRRVAGPRVTRSELRGPNGSLTEYMRPHSSNGFALETGVLINHGRRSADGVSLVFYGNDADGLATALKWRHRLWIDDGQSLDFALGAGKGKLHRPDFTNESAAALTAEVGANADDLVALFVRADMLKSRHGAEPSLNVGIRAGSKAAVVSTVVLGTVAGILAYLLRDGFD